jgi:2-C-methyl-D-erythritol 2,4-cyclodiphosphate synthase
LGDIGELFPDTDEANRGRDSCEMLQLAHRQVGEAGFRVVNVDCIVFAEQPKLTPHKRAMRERIAMLLGLTPAEIGLKAKTGEGMGAVGGGQAMMAQCVALLERIGV